MAAKRRIYANAICGRLGIVRHRKLASIKRERLTSLANPIQWKLTTTGRYRLVIATKQPILLEMIVN